MFNSFSSNPKTVGTKAKFRIRIRKREKKAGRNAKTRTRIKERAQRKVSDLQYFSKGMIYLLSDALFTIYIQAMFRD